jgi:hypothetical protein
VTDPEAVSEQERLWIALGQVSGLVENDAPPYMARLMAALAENGLEIILAADRAALVAERDDWKQAAGAEAELYNAAHARIDEIAAEREQAVAERDAAKMDAADAADRAMAWQNRCSSVAAAEEEQFARAEQAVAERDRYRDALRELLEGLGIELDDARMKYIVAQVDRDSYEAAVAALAVSTP